MAAQLGKKTPISLLKRAWHEIPDIVAGSALAIFSLVSMYGVYKYRSSRGDFEKKRYRFDYTVVRPDDPLAAHAPRKEESQ